MNWLPWSLILIWSVRNLWVLSCLVDLRSSKKGWQLDLEIFSADVDRGEDYADYYECGSQD